MEEKIKEEEEEKTRMEELEVDQQLNQELENEIKEKVESANEEPIKQTTVQEMENMTVSSTIVTPQCTESTSTIEITELTEDVPEMSENIPETKEDDETETIQVQDGEPSIEISFTNITMENQREVLKFLYRVLKNNSKEEKTKNGKFVVHPHFYFDYVGLVNEIVPEYNTIIKESLPLKKKEIRFKNETKCFNCNEVGHDVKTCPEVRRRLSYF
jgi:hypothetical protein